MSGRRETRGRFTRFAAFLRRVVRWLVWRGGQYVLPLPLAWYANRKYLSGPAPELPSHLPKGMWALAEQQRLLDRSEQRLQGIEGKGPGLATVCAVVAAAIAVAISLAWTEATTVGRVLLGAAAFYAAMSLAAPIRLVGPIERSTITIDFLATLVHRADGEEVLARQSAQAASDNDRATVRLGNLLAASRNDVRVAVVLFTAWGSLALFGLADRPATASIKGVSQPTAHLMLRTL